MYSFGTNEYICRIVDQYSRMLQKLALTRLTPTDAEDVVQEVLLKLMTARPHFRDAGHEKAWLIRTTLNYVSDLCKAANRKQIPLDEIETAAPQEETPQLLAAVRALPSQYSAVIHLFYYEGYSIKEIAQILTLPASTVGTRLSRGRERLKEMLKEEFA